MLALLAATSGGYGYHRDELYFRMLGYHPAWGYVDQPPLTPLLARATTALFGDNMVALRIPSMMAAVAAVALTALLARELGGGTRAQLFAAIGAVSAFVLIAGHLLSTATFDLVVWLLVLLFVSRALLRGDRRWWLAAGLVVGLGLYNKHLVVLLLIGIAAGLLIAGPRRELVCWQLWAAVAIALVVGSPNLIYQATHHWPQLTMSRAIAADKGQDDRILFVPLQLVLIGLFLVPFWIAGMIRLFRRPQWRPVRALAWSYPVVAVIVLVTGGQPYYTLGILLFFFAAGSVPIGEWLDRRRARWAGISAVLALNIAVSAVVALPLIPLGSVGATPIPAMNQTVADQVGWPAYVRQVAAAVDALPAADRANAVLVTSNYGEAGALDRYGPQYRLPAVYSGHNELYFLGAPPDSATVAVIVGMKLSRVDGFFASCGQVGTLDNGIGVDNEEQDRTIVVCRSPNRPWHELWPDFQHYD
jgi:4-amino-4-deoxy-L-arabinose transferase-like glycosyltransferase